MISKYNKREAKDETGQKIFWCKKRRQNHVKKQKIKLALSAGEDVQGCGVNLALIILCVR